MPDNDTICRAFVELLGNVVSHPLRHLFLFHETTAPIEPFLAHLLTGEILGTRDELAATINDQGGLKDASGRFISLSRSDETKDRENRWRGALAYVNATYKQELMGSAFDVARQEMKRGGNMRFWIWLHQADGFTMRVRQTHLRLYRSTGSKARWMRRQRSWACRRSWRSITLSDHHPGTTDFYMGKRRTDWPQTLSQN